MIYRFGSCRLDTDRVRLTRDGADVHVEPQVFALLQLLAERQGTVVRKEDLLDQIWGTRFVSESALTSRIRSARQAVGDDGTAQRVIRTVHGRGYELVAPVAPVDEASPGGGSDDPEARPTPRPEPLTPAAAPERPSRLPAAVQPLIGREQLLAELTRAVAGQRLVTLTGPGGVGKTALGFELARRVEHHFTDSAYAVELVTVVDERATLEAFATAVEVNTRQRASIDDAVIDVLRGRQALLLLDNCEHVIEPLANLVHRILRAAPGVTIVATSREPLAVTSEDVWTVPPLPVAPDRSDQVGGTDGAVAGDQATVPPSLDEIGRVPAVALFVARASQADAPFTLDADTAPAVLEICRRLDGLPLAIELAAARARVLDVHEIARRLDERFRLLRAVRRGADPRHGALEDAVSWSYDLLTPAEQQLFAALAVFAGPFDLDAAEQVCGSAGPGQAGAGQVDPGDDVVDLLGRLTERSMVAVRRRPQGGTRYELLETLRQYGRGRLDDDRSLRLFAAHAAHFTAVARRVGAGLQTPAEAAAAARAEGAFADLRAASRFLAEVDDLPAAFALIGSVREYAMRSMRYEVFAWADHIATSGAADRATDDPGYPLLLAVRAYGAWVRGEFDNAVTLAQASRAGEQRLGVDPSGLPERVLANVWSTVGDIDKGLAEMRVQLALAEASGNRSRLAHACYMGSVGYASTGAYDDARRLACQAEEAGAATGSPTDLASASAARGFLAIDDPRAALDAFARAERLARSAGNRWMRAFAHTEASGLLVHLGDIEAGCRGLAEMVDAWYRAGEWPQQWHTLARCVIALDRIGQPAWALEVVGAIESRAAIGTPPVMVTLRDLALGARADLIERLGADRSAELLASGAARPVADVVRRTGQLLLGRLPADA